MDDNLCKVLKKYRLFWAKLVLGATKTGVAEVSLNVSMSEGCAV